MTTYQDFVEASHHLMIVSTSNNNIPSSRMMSYAVDAEDESVWYASSILPNAPKVQQIADNENVAILTAPDIETGWRMNSNRVTMRRSLKRWADVAPLFAGHFYFERSHKQPENEVLFEIHFRSLVLQTLNPAETRIIDFAEQD